MNKLLNLIPSVCRSYNPPTNLIMYSHFTCVQFTGTESVNEPQTITAISCFIYMYTLQVVYMYKNQTKAVIVCLHNVINALNKATIYV